MEALWEKALAEGATKEEEPVEEALEVVESTPSFNLLGVCEISLSKKGKHFCLHYEGRTYNFKCEVDGVFTHYCIKKNTPDVKCIGYIKSLKEAEDVYWVISVRPCTDHPIDNYVVKRKEFIKELRKKSNSVDANPSNIVTTMMEHMSQRERLKYQNADSLRRIASAQKRKHLPFFTENPKSKTLIGRQF